MFYSYFSCNTATLIILQSRINAKVRWYIGDVLYALDFLTKLPLL